MAYFNGADFLLELCWRAGCDSAFAHLAGNRHGHRRGFILPSTLARHTLQALAPGSWDCADVFSESDARRAGQLWPSFAVARLADLFIGVPALLITLVALSFGNFKRVNLGGKVWLQNAFAFAAALAFVIVTTAAVYHRAWEKLTPFEPSHGVARLSLSNPATLSEQRNTFSVRLPGGRIWTDDYTLNGGAPNPLALILGGVSLTSLGDGHFYDGSIGLA